MQGRHVMVNKNAPPCSARSFYLPHHSNVIMLCQGCQSTLPCNTTMWCHYTIQKLRPVVSEALVFNFFCFWESKHFPEEMENWLTLTNWFSFSLHSLQMTPQGLSQAEHCIGTRPHICRLFSSMSQPAQSGDKCITYNNSWELWQPVQSSCLKVRAFSLPMTHRDVITTRLLYALFLVLKHKHWFFAFNKYV